MTVLISILLALLEKSCLLIHLDNINGAIWFWIENCSHKITHFKLQNIPRPEIENTDCSSLSRNRHNGNMNHWWLRGGGERVNKKKNHTIKTWFIHYPNKQKFLYVLKTVCIPSIFKAVRTMKWFSLSASRRCSSLMGSNRIIVWKFPSPAWATTGLSSWNTKNK